MLMSAFASNTLFPSRGFIYRYPKFYHGVGELEGGICRWV